MQNQNPNPSRHISIQKKILSCAEDPITEPAPPDPTPLMIAIDAFCQNLAIHDWKQKQDTASNVGLVNWTTVGLSLIDRLHTSEAPQNPDDQTQEIDRLILFYGQLTKREESGHADQINLCSDLKNALFVYMRKAPELWIRYFSDYFGQVTETSVPCTLVAAFLCDFIDDSFSALSDDQSSTSSHCIQASVATLQNLACLYTAIDKWIDLKDVFADRLHSQHVSEWELLNLYLVELKLSVDTLFKSVLNSGSDTASSLPELRDLVTPDFIDQSIDAAVYLMEGRLNRKGIPHLSVVVACGDPHQLMHCLAYPDKDETTASDCHDSKNWNPLFYAVAGRRWDMLDQLALHRISWVFSEWPRSRESDTGNTILHIAARTNPRFYTLATELVAEYLDLARTPNAAGETAEALYLKTHGQNQPPHV